MPPQSVDSPCRTPISEHRSLDNNTATFAGTPGICRDVVILQVRRITSGTRRSEETGKEDTTISARHPDGAGIDNHARLRGANLGVPCTLISSNSSLKELANGTNDAVRDVGSGVVALVSSDLRADSWAVSVEQTLTRLPDAPSEQAPDALRNQASVPQATRAAVRSPAPAGKGTYGLRSRLLLVDVVAVAGTWLTWGFISLRAATTNRQWGAVLAAAVVTLAAMQLLGLYRSRLCAQRGQETVRIAAAAGAGAVTFELLRGEGGRGYTGAIVAVGVCVVAVIILRWMFYQWLRAQRVRGRYRRGLVMIGTNEDAVAVWTMLDSQPELGYEVRGVIGEPGNTSDWAHLPHSLDLDQLPALAEQTDSAGILVVANALSPAEFHEVISLGALSGLHVQVWPGLRGLGTRRIRRFPMGGETFLYVESAQRPRWQFAVKRAIDMFGAVVGLVVAAPLLLMAWIAIRLEGGGAALYRQVRVGLNGRPFMVYKLRTMSPDAEAAMDPAAINERTDGPLFKATHDPRVTRVGAVVRALSIDEIPQLFNVLNGTMSLVGPRPALPREVAQFDTDLQRRHDVKPGVTGLWQVEARDNPSFHAYRRLDLMYVDNWSIGLDVFILLVTVPMVMAHAVSLCRFERQPQGASSEAL
jgi:exopolysaccharide biosynthesis polyprenyl glycosylphosphotransferase